jgi:hypothetical protein
LKSNLNKVTFLFFVLYFFSILGVGLWPFNFNSKNKVDWLKTENGLNFNKHGIAFTSDESNFPKSISPPLQGDEEISIELQLKPQSYVPNNPAYILCVFDDMQPEIFSISQEKSLLKITVPDSVDSTSEWRLLHNSLLEGQLVWLAITSTKKNTIVYLDGKVAGQYQNYSLVPEKRKVVKWYLVLGNSPFGQKPWIGEIHGLAIYNHFLTPERVLDHYNKWKIKGPLSLYNENNIIALYPINEKNGQLVHNVLADRHHLFIPHRFTPPKKKIFELPRNLFQLNRIAIRDIIINSFGFIPFGFLLFRIFVFQKGLKARRWHFVFLAFWAGAGLSFSIEGLQVFLPTRYSSLSDATLNSFGTVIGALFAASFAKKTLCG